MSVNNNGGPAFPWKREANPQDATTPRSGIGMSLRDYFASKFDPDLSGITANDASNMNCPMPENANFLRWCIWKAAMRSKLRYMEADAMLRARGES